MHLQADMMPQPVREERRHRAARGDLARRPAAQHPERQQALHRDLAGARVQRREGDARAREGQALVLHAGYEGVDCGGFGGDWFVWVRLMSF